MMFLSGLPLSTLLAVGGAAGAAVVVFYILKLRRRAEAVPFSPLWEQVLRDKDATSWFARLRRLLSLLLQLALLTLLLLALGDPRLAPSLFEARTIVVLVDGSASMKAKDVAPDRLGVARREVERLVEGLRGADRVLVARMDAAVEPLSSLTSDKSELHAAIEKLSTTDTRADVRRGVRFALDVLHGARTPEIVLVGDGAWGDVDATLAGLPLGDAKLSYVSVGAHDRNVAISAFAVRRYPRDRSRHEVLLELTNGTDERRELELSLYGDGLPIDVQRLALGPKERLPRSFKDLGGASRRLEARIKPVDGKPDDLPADDRAYALLPERRRARILEVSDGNTYLDAVLLLDEQLDVTVVEPAKFPPASGRFDVTVFDNVAPEVGTGELSQRLGARVYLGPRGAGSPVKVGKAIGEHGFESWKREHPVLRWLALGDVQVESGVVLEPGPGDEVLGSAAEGPILIAGQRNGAKFIALAFDPRRSDLPLRVAWPLLLLKSIHELVEEDASYVAGYRTGDVWYVPAPEGARLATVKTAAGTRFEVPVQQGRAVFFGEHAGFHELTFGKGELTAIAANLVDPEESRIAPVKTLSFKGQTVGAPTVGTPGVERELWTYLLIAALLLSALEWLTYHRRVTV